MTNPATAVIPNSSGGAVAAAPSSGKLFGRPVGKIDMGPLETGADIVNTVCSLAGKVAKFFSNFVKGMGKVVAAIKPTGLFWAAEIPADVSEMIGNGKDFLYAKNSGERLESGVGATQSALNVTLDVCGTAGGAMAVKSFAAAGAVTTEIATMGWIEFLGALTLPVKVIALGLNIGALKACRNSLKKLEANEVGATPVEKDKSVLRYLVEKTATSTDEKPEYKVSDYELKKRFKISDPSQLRKDIQDIFADPEKKLEGKELEDAKAEKDEQAHLLAKHLKDRVSNNIVHKKTKIIANAVSIVALLLLIFVPVVAPFAIALLISTSIGHLYQIYREHKDFQDYRAIAKLPPLPSKSPSSSPKAEDVKPQAA